MNKSSLVWCLAASSVLLYGGSGNAEEKASPFSIYYEHAGMTEITVKDGHLKYSWLTDRIDRPMFSIPWACFDKHQMDVWLTNKEMARFREWMARHKVFAFKAKYPRVPGPGTYGSAFKSVLTVEQKDKKQGIRWDGDSQTPESLGVAIGALIQLADEARDIRGRRPADHRSPRPAEGAAQDDPQPTLPEIWSGKALNVCIDKIRAAHKRGARGPNLPLHEDLLAEINVTRGDDGGFLGPLNKGGRLEWPKGLQTAAYESERKKIDELLREAVKQAKKGEATARQTEDLNRAIQKLQAHLIERDEELNPDQFIEAFRYLRSLKQTVKALHRKDIRDYFTAAHDLPIKCRTVADLVAYLKEKNICIAPASPGSEPGYTLLYYSLAAYLAGTPASREKK